MLIKNVKIIGENEITDGFVRTANGKITEVGKLPVKPKMKR